MDFDVDGFMTADNVEIPIRATRDIGFAHPDRSTYSVCSEPSNNKDLFHKSIFYLGQP